MYYNLRLVVLKCVWESNEELSYLGTISNQTGFKKVSAW